MKKNVCMISIVIITVILIIYIFKINNHTGVVVTFYNETNLTIEHLNIRFSNELDMTPVPSISPKQKLPLKIHQNRNFIEGSLKLIYFGSNQEEHQETIIGYIERGQSAHTRVYINSIDNNGHINVSIKD